MRNLILCAVFSALSLFFVEASLYAAGVDVLPQAELDTQWLASVLFFAVGQHYGRESALDELADTVG